MSSLDLRGSTAGEAVWEIVELLRESGELRKPSEFFEAVMEREEKSLDRGEWRRRFSACADRTRRSNPARDWTEQEGRRLRRGKNSVHLIFVIAVPQQMVNDYLICVGALARTLSAQGDARCAAGSSNAG